MHYLKDIETTVLVTMLAAHSAYNRRSSSKKQSVECKRTISRLESEIELRQRSGGDNIVTNRDMNAARNT